MPHDMHGQLLRCGDAVRIEGIPEIRGEVAVVTKVLAQDDVPCNVEAVLVTAPTPYRTCVCSRNVVRLTEVPIDLERHDST